MDVRIGSDTIAAGSSTTTNVNTRCAYRQEAARDYSWVYFRCPSPGILGNTVTLQHGNHHLGFLEVEVLGI